MDGKRLRAKRLAKRMTLEQLAAKAGVSDRTIGELETRSGGARHSTLEFIAQALGAAVESFAALRDAPAPRAAKNGAAAPVAAAPAQAPPAPKGVKLVPTSLERLVSLEAQLAAAPPLSTADGQLEAMSAKRFQDVFTAYATYEGERFYLRGCVKLQRGAPANEAKLLGSKSGVAARFFVEVEIAAGETLGVTLHTWRAEETRAMQAALGREVTVRLRVVVAPEDVAAQGAGFLFFLSERPRPWALAVDGVEAAAAAVGAKAPAKKPRPR